MYIEFIIIYIMLGIMILLLSSVLILQIVHIKKVSHTSTGINMKSKKPGNNSGRQVTEGVVFCMSCAEQFPASERVCPHCGTAR